MPHLLRCRRTRGVVVGVVKRPRPAYRTVWGTPRRRGSRPDHAWPSRKNGRRARSVSDRVGEQEDDEQVDQRRQAQGEGEAAHARAGQRVERRAAARKLTPSATRMVRLARFQPVSTAARERAAVTQLVTHPLEVDDERVGGEADGDDEAGDAGHVEAVVVRPAQDRDRQVGDQAGDEDRGDRDEAQGAVLEQRVHDDEEQADQAGDQAVAQLLAAQGRADVDAGLLDERQRQRTELQLVGQAAGARRG